ncbi:2-C-methyl-D-erythritol 4-phosphate cytidylyltransferase [Anaerotalea alkaliphila]|uniref:2-C-methyl-D-erythritol 4-phosphate cytidylyltransferase n=1 Tax=Anaerotalea alkaliphila TaxID=2662126 RepID=A0A7X5HVW7_9FIRM|nr:2-C-methyl-D-erythritol 4-phosphate cytidylyltransferase [Anaerotalea alkaliphila]NDL67628.1 2-C-methyl-D-erythritol 4-phosphate cytidylyltransferase [Anaerotalea alkaliphila]
MEEKGKIHVAVIIPAAGSGSRMGLDTPKQFLRIRNKPLLVHALERFQESEDVQEIILVTGREDIPWVTAKIVEAYGLEKVRKVVEGGRERKDSVYAGILNLSPQATHVLVHDGARPCLSRELIRRMVQGAVEKRACVPGVPLKDTVKTVDREGRVLGTPPRNSLSAIQTPQAFSREVIEEAYTLGIASSREATDDAMMVELFTDTPVHVLEGENRNIKVTTKEDLETVERWLGEAENSL